MKFYEATTPKEALRMALNDEEMSWTKWEKRALETIIGNDDNVGVSICMGVNWKASEKSRIVFHTKAGDFMNGYANFSDGYTVGRLMW